MGNDIKFKVLSQFENVQVISQGQRILVLLWNDFHPIVYYLSRALWDGHHLNDVQLQNKNLLFAKPVVVVMYVHVTIISTGIMTYCIFQIFCWHISIILTIILKRLITYQQETVSLFNSQVIDLEYSVKVKSPVIHPNTF